MTKRLNRPEEEVVKQYFPGFMVLDSTEQEIPRPKDRMKKDTLLWQEEKTYSKESTQ